MTGLSVSVLPVDGAPASVSAPAEVPRPPRAPAPSDPGHLAGRCSEHPGETLVPPRRIGIYWDPRRQAIACPSRDHNAYDRDRCTWCGHDLWPERQYRGGTSARRAHCNELCRNYAWRAARAAKREQAKAAPR